ncbi:hypothetical protein [Arthrobacter sp. ISL-69]|uniref:hypothetical protein n=1 Tax=Arthrobacter sp. ISL-69 TaxID=2819113 RepID=UPI001BE62125|nr:hypothetical protein [Arthrobacter sp. ISL-69]MBT2539047.1 hypothetical protein [Arthrobacter sp. ISL-69]
MSSNDEILKSAQAQFSPSANKRVRVLNAWRREDSTLERPAPNGWEDGWTEVHQLATYAVVAKLRDQGFTVVNLATGGTTRSPKDVPITNLI